MSCTTIFLCFEYIEQSLLEESEIHYSGISYDMLSHNWLFYIEHEHFWYNCRFSSAYLKK
jgi:hypothetical protein